ncbi:MAG: site-specific DNA-methyltransferase [Mogibacterium sp.]|nr:site-specific DNA-methyltransferase [Mogibacterium sp.]
MTTIEQILEGINKGRTLYESVQGSVSAEDKEAQAEDRDMRYGSTYEEAAQNASSGELFLGDNLDYMKDLFDRGFEGAFQLIYIDPPFFTRSSFDASVSVRGADGSSHRVHHLAFDDKFDRSLEYYIENMTARLLMMRELLADDGLMWIHLDWHSSHYIKLVLDELMGSKNFVNEIIWCYKSGGSGKKHFARKHDTILVYSKTSGYYLDVPEEKSYNRDLKPYRFKGVKEYRDDIGWYTLVNMKDVWNIDMVGRTSAERTGYATQKPLELMRRIIGASTREGDLVGDFFCGSGSALEAAYGMGRRFAGCDSEELACSMTRRRLYKAGAGLRFVKSGKADARSGRADIIIDSKDPLEDGRFLFKCRLSELLPDIDTGSIQIRDRKYVDEALLADRLQFADHVLVNTDPASEDGQHLVFDTGLDEMIFISPGTPSAAVVDIFGKEYPAEIAENADSLNNTYGTYSFYDADSETAEAE